MLPALAIGGGILQGALGFFRAKQQQKEAKRQAAINNGLAGNDTVFGAFSKGLDRGRQVGAVSDQGPSALGGALSGGLSGVMQGMNVYQGLQQAALDKAKLDKLIGQSAQASALGIGQSADANINAYRNAYLNS